MIASLASVILAPVILEAALRALFAAVAVWAGMRLLRVGNVLVQKAAWGLVLIAALAMPFAPRWQILPASLALRLPSLHWSESIRTPNTALAPQSAAAPDRYPAPSISNAAFSDVELPAPLVIAVPDTAPASSEFASPSEPRASASGIPSKQIRFPGYRRTHVKPAQVSGHDFSRAISPTEANRASAPEGASLATSSVPATSAAASSTTSSRKTPIRFAAYAWLLYLGVFAALLLRLIFGLVSALRLWITAEPITTIADDDDASCLRSSTRVASPVNIGSGIILPADYAEWDEEKLRIVLAHERSHVRQGDFYLQLLAGFYASLFWFSPLGWWLKRKLNELGEAISDRAGLEEAASRSSYAQILLEFAALPRPTLTGVAMARTSHLSQRIERLLNESSFRRAFAAGGRRALLAVLVVPVAIFAATALVRVPAAASPAPQPQPAAQASLAGQSTPQQITDQSGNPAPAPAPAATPDPASAAAPAPPAPPDEIIVTNPGPDPAGVPAPRAPQTIMVAPNPPNGPLAPLAPIAPDRPMVLTFKGMDDRMVLDKSQIALQVAQAKLAGGPLYLYLGDGDDYAIVGDPGTHVRFSGNWDGDRVEAVEKARKVAHGHFLLFQHEDKTYIIDDPAIVAQVAEMNKPLDDLDDRMRDLSKQMREYGEQQREAARKARESAIQVPDLSKEIAELNAAAASLQAKQGTTISQKDLGDLQRQIAQIEGRLGSMQGKIAMEQFHVDMGQFGAEQGKLGGEMGKLGAQIGQTARENESKMKGIITDSLSNGKAKPIE